MNSDNRCNNISPRWTWASSCATTDTSTWRLGGRKKAAGIRMKGCLTPQVNGPHADVDGPVENTCTRCRLMLRSKFFGRTDSRIPGSTRIARRLNRLAATPPCSRRKARYNAGAKNARSSKRMPPGPFRRAGTPIARPLLIVSESPHRPRNTPNGARNPRLSAASHSLWRMPAARFGTRRRNSQQQKKQTGNSQASFKNHDKMICSSALIASTFDFVRQRLRRVFATPIVFGEIIAVISP